MREHVLKQVEIVVERVT